MSTRKHRRDEIERDDIEMFVEALLTEKILKPNEPIGPREDKDE